MAKDAAIELPAHAVTVSSGLKPEAIGAQVAQSVYVSFAGGPAQKSTAQPAAAGNPVAQRGGTGGTL